MSQQIINISNPDDGLGDALRKGFDKSNQNFTELYNSKVDKVTGKGLSENDFTNSDKTKLDGIEAGAQVNVQADAAETDPLSPSYIQNFPPSLYSAVGHFHYADLATQTTPLAVVANVPKKITNDTLGVHTELGFAPYAVPTVWDEVQNSFDFSNLDLGDSASLRLDLSISTTAANQTIELFLKFGVGTSSEYVLLIDSWNEKSTVTFKHFLKTIDFSIDNQDWKNAPAELYILSDANASVKVNGFYIPIIRKSVNIIDFQHSPIYKQKNESRKFSAVLSGTDQVIEFRAAGHQHYEISGTVTSVAGFGKTLLLSSPSAEIPYAGKDIFFENNSGHDITLKDNFSGVDVKFNLGADLIVPTNGIVWLKYDAAAENLALFFKNWSEVDLSTKADLVGGKVPAVQLPSSVFNIIEGYFNGTNFYTDALFTNLITPESGKIYVALDTGLTYRWGGSVYVQVGGSGSSDTYSYWFSYTASHVTSVILYTQVANAILATSGTQSLITRVGTNLYNSYHFLNWVSSTANGSNAGVKINNNADVPYRAGVEAHIIFGNNSDNVNHVTAVGSYGLLSAVPNLDIANFTTDFVGVGNDPTDTNLSFYCKRQEAPSSYIKVPTNSNFPAHTLASDVFMLKFETNRVSVQADFQIKLTLTNLINGAVISHTFTGLECPDLNRSFINTVNRSNRNTGVATAIRWIKTYIKAKYF